MIYPYQYFFLIVTAALVRRRSFPEVCQKTFGRTGGAGMLLLYSAWFLFSGALSLSYYGRYSTETVLGGMSAARFLIPLGLVALYAARQGTRPLGRLGFLLGIPLLAGTLLSAALKLGSGDLRCLLPAANVTPGEFFGAAAAGCAVSFGDLTCAILLAPRVTRPRRLFALTLCASAVGNLAVFALMIGGIALSGQSTWLYEAAYLRPIVSDALLEAVGAGSVVLVCAYFLSMLFRVCLLLNAATECAASVLLRVPKKRLAVFAGGAMLLLSLFLFGSSAEAASFYRYEYPFAAGLFYLALPLLLLFGA